MVYQIICGICGICKASLCTCLHVCLIKLHGGNHTCKQSDTSLYRINGIERKLFVFLHIFVICKRDSLHSCKDRCQRTVDTACFSTDKLCDIRVLFLRHDTAACAICIIDLNETVLIGIPKNNLLGKAAQMHHNGRKRT